MTHSPNIVASYEAALKLRRDARKAAFEAYRDRKRRIMRSREDRLADEAIAEVQRRHPTTRVPRERLWW
jgi:hypothetical protein